MFVAIASSAYSAHAQTAADGFNPGANNRVRALVALTDGRLVAGGDFTTLGSGVNALPRNYIGLINIDGSIDPAFDPGPNGTVHAIVVQADGRLIVGGEFTSIGGHARAHLARLNADGSVDPSFTPGTTGVVFALAIQADGRIVAGGGSYLTRFTVDGSSDAGFSAVVNGPVRALAVQANHRIVAGGEFTTLNGSTAARHVGRVLPSGILDATFAADTGGPVRAIATQLDGRVVLGGDFGVVRLSPTGADEARLGTNGPVSAVVRLENGSVVVGGGFTQIGNVVSSRIARLSRQAEPDAGFTAGADGAVLAIAALPNGLLAVGGAFTRMSGGGIDVARMNLGRVTAGGRVDVDFNPAANNTVIALALQPDGKVLVGGLFTTLGGTRRNYLGRLNADGSVDATFNPGANDAVLALAVQQDGRIIVGGAFTTLGGGGMGTVTRHRLGRLNADGSIDSTFDSGANNQVNVLALQSDGRILVGGQFTALGGGGAGTIARRRLGRLNADGSPDLEFDPGVDNPVHTIAITAGGQILVGGSFTMLGGGGMGNTDRAFIARLNADGSLDAGFDPGADGTVQTLALDAAGRILVGGSFTTLGGGGMGTTARAFLGRLNPDGTVDASFDVGADGDVHAIATEADGGILVAGAFSRLGGGGFGNILRSRLGRLDANGVVDAGFNPGANNTVWSLAQQGDGRLLVGGAFTTLGGGGTGTLTRAKIGRLATARHGAQRLDVVDVGRAMSWTREGSVPEISGATLEISTDGVTFVPLGAAEPIEGAWHLQTTPMPVNQRVLVRARGGYASGHQNGSRSSVESVRDVYFAMPTVIAGAVAPGVVGSAYSTSFSTTGDVGVVSFGTAGHVPMGLTLSAAGVLSGIPVEPGTFSTTVTATDHSSGSMGSTSVTLVIGCQNIALAASFASGAVGTAYGPVAITQSGGMGSVTFAISSGQLPPGLSLSSAGAVTGSPSEAGAFSFTIRATDGNSCSGTATYSVAVLSTPTIVSHPQNQIATAGGNAVFSTAATGSPAPTYRWQVSTNGGATWSDVSSSATYAGVTSATLSVMAIGGAHSGEQYRAVASNSVGSVASSAAVLTVHTSPSITAHPVDRTVVEGNAATFSVAATSNPAPSYQWQVSTTSGAIWEELSNSSTYTGVRTAMLAVAAGASHSGHQFRAVVANGIGSTASNAAVLTVHTSPSITEHAVDRTVVEGTVATFSVAAAGNPAPAIQWQMSTNNGATWDDLSNSSSYSGVRTATLGVAAAAGHSGHQFRAVASNSSGSSASTGARLIVQSAPSFLSPPGNQVTIEGGTASFTVLASGAPAPSYRWQMSSNGGSSWTDLASSAVYSGVDASLLVLNGVMPALSGNAYRAIATNLVGSAASTAGVLTVYTAPAITTHPTDRTVTAGSSVSFAASAAGNPWPVYQWQVLAAGTSSWSNVSTNSVYAGSTSGVLTVSSATPEMSGSRFRCVATNSVSSVTSSSAQLTVNVPPTIASHPASVAVDAGQGAGFSVGVSGSPIPGIVWQESGNGGASWSDVANSPVYSGSTSATLVIGATSLGLNGRRFRAVAANSAGGATSNAAVLTVHAVSDPRLALESPVAGATVSESFAISGWAVDLGAPDSAGVDAVEVQLFHLNAGAPGALTASQNATSGSPRPDVGSEFGPRFTNAGFSAQFSEIPPGPYRLVVRARSVVTGTFNNVQAVDFAVEAPAPHPLMALDAPSNGASLGRSFDIAGWAVDLGAWAGSGVDAVHVWAYPWIQGGLGEGVLVGAATVGLTRPDIAAAFGAQFNNAGFSLRASGLSPGSYRLTVLARSVVSESFNQSMWADVVIAQPVSNPLMALDAPAHGATVGSTFPVAGWALDLGSDLDADPGVSAVHVWAYWFENGTLGAATFVGVASYGAARPDVGAVFGSRFANSGFRLDNAALPPGSYRLVAFAHSTIANAFNHALFADVTVGEGAIAASGRPPVPADRRVPVLTSLAADTRTSQSRLAAGLSVWRVEEGNWVEIKAPDPDQSPINVLVRSERDRSVIWIGHANGTLFRTANGDDGIPQWTALRTDVLPRAAVTALAMDPLDRDVVYAAFEGNGELWRTRDGGQTWISLTDRLPERLRDAAVRALAAGPGETTRVVVGTDRGVLVSGDRGDTWVLLAGVDVSQLLWDGTRLIVVTRAEGVVAADAFTNGDSY